jgi:hypothetical protein
MSLQPGDRSPAATGGTVNEDHVSSARANARQAIAAFEAIGECARAEARRVDALPPGTRRGPAQGHAPLARTLCALRHLADQFSGISFSDALRTANQQYMWLGPDYSHPSTAPSVTMANEAIGTCLRGISAPRQYDGTFWPPDTLSYLHDYASSHGLGFEPAVASLTTRLLASLRHYADHQGTDFQQALSAGIQAHARQRLRAEGPFRTGLEPGQPPPLGSFHPTATNQGVVASPGDAEWLLIRTAARNQEHSQNGLPPDRRDADDERVLADALAQTHGRTPEEILTGLAPQITARVMQIEDGPATAADLGREHGRARTQPSCDLEIDGDATALLQALGETEWTTDANHPYRLSLVTAYAEAYQQAAGRGPALADSPARIAARDFPRTNPTAVTPSSLDSGRPARATPQAPRPGPRPALDHWTREEQQHLQGDIDDQRVDPRGDPRAWRHHRPAHPRLDLRAGPVALLPDGAHRGMGAGRHPHHQDRHTVPRHRPVHPERPRGARHRNPSGRLARESHRRRHRQRRVPRLGSYWQHRPASAASWPGRRRRDRAIGRDCRTMTVAWQSSKQAAGRKASECLRPVMRANEPPRILCAAVLRQEGSPRRPRRGWSRH